MSEIISVDFIAEQQAAELMEEAEALYQDDKRKESTATYTKIIQLPGISDKTRLDALYRRANYREWDEPEAAFVDYAHVLENPAASAQMRSTCIFNQADILDTSGWKEEAITLWSKLKQFESLHPYVICSTFMRIAITFEELGKRAEAIHAYSEVVEVKDGCPWYISEAYIYRGLQKGKLGDLEGELEDYTLAIEYPLRPAETMAKALFYRAISYDDAKRYDEAEEDRAYAYTLPDVPVDILANGLTDHSFTLYKRGMYEESTQKLTRIIDELTDVPVAATARALRDRGDNYRETGYLYQAIADFSRAIDLADCPADILGSALRHRATIYMFQGKTADAAADCQRILSSTGADADDVEAARALLATC